MFRRMIVPLIFGLVGAAILIGLGVWQLQRLAWKEAVLAEIDARIPFPPIDLPATIDPAKDDFLAVVAEGTFTGEVIQVLVSRKEDGAGVKVIAAFQLPDGRRVMVDRGFRPDAAKADPMTVTAARVVGNLHWPDEIDSYTPSPDPVAGLWFARDVPAMATTLRTEPVLIVAKEPTGDGIEPMPVDSGAIPNNHFSYAIQWFSLAAVWLGMTGYLLWRIRRRTA